MRELKIIIDNSELDVTDQETSPVLITYELEDEKDFQQKGSATAFDATFPATLRNQQTFNSFSDPKVVDMSPDSRYRKARTARIMADSIPVLIGKALLKNGTHSNRPEDFTVNFYGDNGDWIVEMQDLTLYDCLPTTTHLFALYGAAGMGGGVAPYGIEDTWFFDGNNEAQSWVYAPVRYAEPFADTDSNIKLTQMRPSLFLYWIIYRAFKRFGYRISSQFMDSPTFRRLVLPWTWGNFLGISSKLSDLMKFRATGSTLGALTNYFHTEQSGTGTSSGSGMIFPGTLGSPFAIGDSFSLNNVSSNSGFDNNGNYSFNNATGMWTWTYKAVSGVSFGTITAFFGVSAAGHAGASSGSNASIHIDVYKNAVLQSSNVLFDAQAPGSTAVVADTSLARIFNFSVSGLVLNDTVSIRFRFTQSKSFFGQTVNTLTGFDSGSPNKQTTFELFRIEIEPGGIVSWANFDQFKKYKFLDLLRGTLDLADLIPKTDPISKTVVIEPAHSATVGAASFTGYHLPNRLNWSDKQDLAQPAVVESYDEPQRDFIFKMREDGKDGGLIILGKRYSLEPAAGKFRFNSRFKEGQETFDNRFFSAVTHLRMPQWSGLPGGQGRTPQIVAIVPENISNTSAGDSEYDFAPKICFYKGYILGTWTNGAGVFRFNNHTYAGYPYMFAVNYQQPGGENDIVLTYNDQRINGAVVPGLLRRFFLQRLAIQDNGVKYKPWLRLNHTDVTNWMHRERISIGGTLYLLTNIDRWDPLTPVSTQCTLWKFTPIEQKHRDQVFPSSASVLGALNPVPAPDLSYQQMFILSSDLP